MTISPMREVDIPQIAKLAGQLGYPSSIAEIESRFATLRMDPTQSILVARASADPSAVIGWVHLFRHLSLTGPARAELGGLVVDQSHRGQGVGARLMAEVEVWAKLQGLETVRFSSNSVRTEAHRFYQRLGYSIQKTSHIFTKTITK